MFKRTNAYHRCQFDIVLGIKRTCKSVLEFDPLTPVPEYPMCRMHGERFKRLLVERAQTEKNRKAREYLDREERILSRDLDTENGTARSTHSKNARVTESC